MVELAPQDGGLYAVGFAGDTFNTAWYARQVLGTGWDVQYFTAVGMDDASDRMIRFMKDAGIGTEQILRRKDRTVGLYMITLKGAERSFSYWRSTSAAKTLADDTDYLDQALSGVELAYFSGITLAILDVKGRQTLLQALSRVRSKGTKVAFDPNLRPRLWASIEEMCDSVTAASAIADIVLPSHEDEATFFGDKDSEATALRYLTAGSKVVVVKDGPGEILFARAGDRYRFKPPVAEAVVDTTAAGDSFNAGFLASFLDGCTEIESMAAGAKLAAKVISARGALVV
ncbi:sugar kinase [Thioclava sp. FR2]|uniref:sugar kinase n=1 Tax=Thioclava sp. FR2 TaxID=3445780 RepID=UPI003EB8136A